MYMCYTHSTKNRWLPTTHRCAACRCHHVLTRHQILCNVFLGVGEVNINTCQAVMLEALGEISDDSEDELYAPTLQLGSPWCQDKCSFDFVHHIWQVDDVIVIKKNALFTSSYPGITPSIFTRIYQKNQSWVDAGESWVWTTWRSVTRTASSSIYWSQNPTCMHFQFQPRWPSEWNPVTLRTPLRSRNSFGKSLTLVVSAAEGKSNIIECMI